MKLDTKTTELILQQLRELPAHSLQEVEEFIEFLRFKQERGSQAGNVALAGLLNGYKFSDEQIAEARREMWGGMDDTAQ